MNQKSVLRTFAVITAILFALVSCQKEVSFETNNLGNGGGSGSGGSGGSTGTTASYGWSFTHNSSKFSGCVDTAYYDQANGIKILSIEGSDAAGNSVEMLIPSLSRKITATTYTAAQGAVLLFTASTGTSYISTSSASSFSISISAVSDTSVTASFKAALTDPLTNNNFALGSGSIKALIGKTNPCSQNNNGGGGTGGSGGSGGNGGGSGGNGGTAAYTLVSSGNGCSVVSLDGNYNTTVALTSANKVTLKVNVTQTGTWNMTTQSADGISFSGSGNFTTTGDQTIVLTGSGTPTDVGSITFSISAGTTACDFYVPVIAAGTASCNPADNTADFSGVASITFSYVAHDANVGGYTITANGNNGDISLEFPGPGQPKPGVYHIQNVGVINAVDDVAVYAVASSVLWQSSTGNVYVTVNNGKVTAVICGESFSGSLGGPSYTTKLTARITEK